MAVEAVRLAEELRPKIIVMDIGMPQLNGWRLPRNCEARPGRGGDYFSVYTAKFIWFGH